MGNCCGYFPKLSHVHRTSEILSYITDFWKWESQFRCSATFHVYIFKACSCSSSVRVQVWFQNKGLSFVTLGTRDAVCQRWDFTSQLQITISRLNVLCQDNKLNKLHLWENVAELSAAFELYQTDNLPNFLLIFLDLIRSTCLFFVFCLLFILALILRLSAHEKKKLPNKLFSIILRIMCLMKTNRHHHSIHSVAALGLLVISCDFPPQIQSVLSWI